VSRRKFTKEFKESAVMRLEEGASTAEVARACELSATLLNRWKQELRSYGSKAFSGHGKSRRPIQPKSQAVICRLTHDEYEVLTTACFKNGAPSVSAFARSRMLEATGEPSFIQVEKELDDILVTLMGLKRILAKLR
jgi:transposase-like protein